jgi:hypothetical protein
MMDSGGTLMAADTLTGMVNGAAAKDTWDAVVDTILDVPLEVSSRT